MNDADCDWQDNEVYYIDCIGVDRKIHVCEPHASKTLCGINILKKNPSTKAIEGLYSCYECNY